MSGGTPIFRRSRLMKTSTSFISVLVFPLPNFLTQLGARKDPSGFAHQDTKQSQLTDGDLDPARPPMDFVVREIEHEIRYLEFDGRLLGVAPTERGNPRHQLLHRERFCQIIVRSNGEAVHSIVQFAARGQDQNPAVDVRFAQTAQNLESVDAG